MRKFFILFIVYIIQVQNNYGQFTEFHPELDWYTIKGEHVSVHFHSEAERTAQVVLKIAEDVWGPITSLYEYEPDRVHFVIKDIDDYSNGATYFFDNKIEIWASSMDFDLRGSHNWLRNVISHEFTHMVQIQAAMKVGRSIPAVYIQYLNYEDKRRPDILYGYPNIIASYPLATLNMPAWFAEGTAQYMRTEFNYDNWDTQRDMILRCKALSNKLLTWNQMGVFGKNSIGNESVYNAGFSLTRYISQKYGEDKLRKITKALSKKFNFTIDAAIEDVLHITGYSLYNEWKEFISNDYKKRISNINVLAGEKLNVSGDGNFHPKFSCNGENIFYLSNTGNDYLTKTAIYKYNLKSKTTELILENVHSTFALIDNDSKIIYSKLSEDNRGWANIHDLFIYDLNSKNEKRLTHGLRANNPDVSPDGKLITFIYQKDGSTNIGTVNIDGKNFRRLTFFESGEQIYNPKFIPDGSKIIFDFSYANGRDIALVDTNGTNLKFILNKKYDERNPIVFGNNIIFASDSTGIFNLYSYNLTSKEIKQISNVIGGSFMPSINKWGDIVYSGYTADGFKLFILNHLKINSPTSFSNYVNRINPPTDLSKPNGDITKFNLNDLINYNDRKNINSPKEKYSGAFTKISFMPFVRIDNYNTSGGFLNNIKPGIYVMSNDMLNRVGFFAGASINKRMERDLFLNFNYRSKLPLLYNLGFKPEVSLELYSVSRKSDANIYFGADTNKVTNEITYDYIIPTDVTYNLFEADLVLKHRIFTRGTNLEFRYVFSRYSASIGSFTIPNTTTLYKPTEDKYLIANSFRLKFQHKDYHSYVDSDINPVGRKIVLRYNYEMNKFNNKGEYEIKNGTLRPQYNKFYFNSYDFSWDENIRIKNSSTLNFKLRSAGIIGKTVPDFFDFYLGGLVGMKSYPFYAVSGNKLMWFNLTYRFPLFKNIDTRFGQIYLDKIFMSLYADYGNAWTNEQLDFNKFKKGAGVELRVKMNSFYIFPTSLFFNASYSFDKFTRKIRDKSVTYGKEWSFYGGILFDFPF